MRALITRFLAVSIVAFLLLTSIPVQFDTGSSADASSIPSSYNSDTDPRWNYGELFPIRNQGNLGTCWAHAASEAIESSLYVKYGDSDRRISPLAMAYTIVDCYGEDESYKYNDIISCTSDGKYITSGSYINEDIYGLYSGKYALVPEYCAPYNDAYLNYDFTSLKSGDAENYVIVKEIENYNLQTDRDIIKQKLMDGYIGSFGYRVEGYGYTDGTMTESDYYYEYRYGNHAVALVGWDDNYPKEKFENEPANDGAWRIRNSWGTSTMDGYCWISYESVIENVFFVTDVEYHVSDGRISNVYSYDMGYSCKHDILCNGSVMMSNIFTAESDERLDGVSFSAYSNSYNTIGEEYTITVYRLNDDYTSPVDGEPIASASGKVKAQGIVYEGFSSPVTLSEGDVFSAVIELSNPTGNVIIPIDTEEDMGSNYYYTAANPGESFINTDGEWKDVSSDRMTNVRIKAYTSSEMEGAVGSSDGSRYYPTVMDAIDDGTYDIKLYADVQLDSRIAIDNDLSLDLNGYKLTSTVSGYVFDMPQNDLLIRNGYLCSSDDGINAKHVTILNAELNCSDIAVDADSADIEIVKITDGSVVLNGTAGSRSYLCCECCDTVTVSNNELTVSAGVYNNNLEYDSTVDLSIYEGKGFKADTREEIESKIAQSSKDAGYRAIGDKDTGWNIEVPVCYLGTPSTGEPYDQITALMLLPNAMISLATDRDPTVTVTGEITIDLCGYTLSSAGITVSDGASLTLYNGNVTISDRLTIESGGRLIIGSADSETTVNCDHMIDAKKGSEISIIGDGTHMVLEFTVSDTGYHLYGGSFSYAGSKTVQIYEGYAEDIGTSERTDCTMIRTSWEEDGCLHDSLVSIPGGSVSLYGSSLKKDSLTYENHKQNGIFTLNIADHLKDGEYSVWNTVNDGTNKVESWIQGLRFSDTVSDSIVDSVCRYADESISNNQGVPYEFILTYYVMSYTWHDPSLPYKIFSAHAIDELKERNCRIIFDFNHSTVEIDLTSDFESADYYAVSEIAQNALLTDAQKKIIGNNSTYYIACSSDDALKNGVDIYLKGYTDSLMLYRIDADGTFTSVDFTAETTWFFFNTDKVGIFSIAEKKGTVAGTGPVPVKDLVSSGKPQGLITPASDMKGGYAQYSLDGIDWSSDIPTASDAGKYTVYYRFVPSELGYLESEVGSVEVSIAEAPVNHESEERIVIAVVIVLAALTALLAAVTVIRRN